MIDAVLFDLDDTLLSWEAPGWTWREINGRRCAAAAAHLGRIAPHAPSATALEAATYDAVIGAWRETRADPALRSPNLGAILCDALDRLGFAREGLDVHALCDAYGWEAVPGVVPFADALPVLDALRAAGVRTGIVTNSLYPRRLRVAELTALGLLDRVDVCVTSGDVGYVKPHPSIYRAALDAIGVAPGRAAFVGDRPERDVKGANALGMTSVLFRPAYLPPIERFGEGETPRHVVSGLLDVVRIVT